MLKSDQFVLLWTFFHSPSQLLFILLPSYMTTVLSSEHIWIKSSMKPNSTLFIALRRVFYEICLFISKCCEISTLIFLELITWIFMDNVEIHFMKTSNINPQMLQVYNLYHWKKSPEKCLYFVSSPLYTKDSKLHEASSSSMS